MTAATTATATAAAASQELSQSGKSPDPSRAGTKYPVQRIPHFDEEITASLSKLNVMLIIIPNPVGGRCSKYILLTNDGNTY